MSILQWFSTALGRRTDVNEGTPLPVAMRTADGDDLSPGGKVLIGGARDKWRDSCNGWSPDLWDASGIDAGDIATTDGNSQGVSFTRLSLSCQSAGTRSLVRGLKTFRPPYRLGVGLSLSQRLDNELVIIRSAAVDPDTGLPILVDGHDGQVLGPAIPVSAAGFGIVVASGTLRIPTTADHGLVFDDLFAVINCADQRLSAIMRVTEVRNRRCVVASFTITSGGYAPGASCVIRKIDLSAGCKDCFGLAFMDSASANAIHFTRAQGSPVVQSGQVSFGTSFTDALVPSARAYAVNLQPRFVTELVHSHDVVRYGAVTIDSSGTPGGYQKRTQSVPDPSLTYAVFVDALRLPSAAIPIEIADASRTASATAIVNLKTPLPVSSGTIYIRAYGGSDATKWPNITTETAATVLSATQLSVTWGSSDTTQIRGGVIVVSQRTAASVGVVNTALRGANWANGKVWAAMLSAPSINVGDIVRLMGCQATDGSVPTDINGKRFRVLAVGPNVQETGIATGFGTTSGNGTITMTDTAAIPLGATLSGTGVGSNAIVTAKASGVSVTVNVNSTATGTGNADLTMTGLVLEPLSPADAQPDLDRTQGVYGAVIRETDVRFNFWRCLDYTRTPVEITGGHYTGDESLAAPAKVLGTVSASTSEAAILAASNGNVTTTASTNAASIKTTASSLLNVTVTNLTAATIYLKFYNKASAPTVGTDVPLITIPVAAGARVAETYGRLGKRFSTGLALSVTAGIGDTDATAVAAGAKINFDYV